MSLEIRDNSREVVDMINELEWIRKQIYDLKDRWAGRSSMPILAAGRSSTQSSSTSNRISSR